MEEIGQDSFQMTNDIETNIRTIFAYFNSSDDVRSREFTRQETRGSILYLTTCIDKDKLQSEILKPLLQAQEGRLEDSLPILDLKVVTDLKSAAAGMLEGKCAILLEQRLEIVLVDASRRVVRNVGEPQNEQTVRGSHVGFVDDVSINLQLIHQRLKNENLVERHFTLGSETPTNVKLLYMCDIADLTVVDEVIANLLTNQATFIKSSGQITDRLESSHLSPFPQLLFTERPDTTVAHLMEGRIALLVDGSSFATILPVTFFMFFQAADDFNVRWWNGTFFRFLRLISVMIGIALPSVYISIVSNHFDILPIDLVFSLKASLENIPFNPLMEAMFMTTVLELLREAAIRLPKSIAATLSIVGGLVIGSEVVNANLVSTTMIVVISLTAVASFSMPSHEMRLAIRLISFPIMFASALLGFAGIAFSFSLLFMHLCKLETFGVPYFFPFAPFKPRRILTTLVQLPKRIFGSKASDRRAS